MRRIRVQGLVKLAQTVRRQLAGGVSRDALDALRERVEQTLEQLDLLLADEELTPAALPGPSRRAYEFLKGVDFDAVETCETPAAGPHAPGEVTITGLRGLLRNLLNGLSVEPGPGPLAELHDILCARLTAIEALIETHDLRSEHLKEQTRWSLAWLRYFSSRENYDAYAAAVARARPAFEREAAASGKFPRPVAVHFRPIKGIWRIRAVADGTRVELPVPMIVFPAEVFERLAARAFRRAGSDEAIVERMLAGAYQDVLAELEALSGGGTGSAAGVYHDLAAAFDRVNAAYFEGRLARPRLLWGRAFTMRKFGHYDRIHDTVLVSASLDAAGVPGLAVDFIVYHELLHRELGVDWKNGRRAAHTPDFRRAERRFRQFDEAREVLRRLSSQRA